MYEKYLCTSCSDKQQKINGACYGFAPLMLSHLPVDHHIITYVHVWDSNNYSCFDIFANQYSVMFILLHCPKQCKLENTFVLVIIVYCTCLRISTTIICMHIFSSQRTVVIDLEWSQVHSCITIGYQHNGSRQNVS